jgi:demethylmenaquinone methyltransferase/2-methoxy-6-polyprenyl-1,4-benzoquinol methylase
MAPPPVRAPEGAASRPHASLRRTIASPATKAAHVRALFATIADRYDLITVLLSFGQDQRWKRRLIRFAGPLTCLRVVDLACGTGDIACLAAAAGADVTGIDITPRMIALARERARESGLRRMRFLVGDMAAIPLPDNCVDIVTTGYGLRNVPDLDKALAEIHRVLKPGGRFLSLDFNRPAIAPVRLAYLAYLTVVGSALGWLLHRDPDTYRYIPESIRLYPGAPTVVERLRRAGFGQARWHRVLGGLLAIHVADKR